jgi:hypothetical protein
MAFPVSDQYLGQLRLTGAEKNHELIEMRGPQELGASVFGNYDLHVGSI